MRQIKQLGKDTLIYGAGHLLRRSAGLLLIPVFTRFLTPEDYGYLELLNITLSILLVVFSQGLGTSFFRAYADLQENMASKLKKLVSTSCHYLFLVTLLCCSVLYILSEEVAWLLFGTAGQFAFLIKVLSATVFFQVVTLIPFQHFRANFESIKYVTVSILQFFIQMVFSIYFVVVRHMGIEGILLAGLISSALIAVLALLMIRKNIGFTLSSSMVRDLVAFGLPLVPAALAFWILSVSDRFMLEKLATTHELGLYSLGSRFANILTFLLVAPFQTAWGPLLFRIAGQEDGKETLKRVTTYFFTIACFIGMVIVVAMPVAIRVIAGEEFWSAYRVVLPLVYANIAGGMFIIMQIGVYYFKKTKLVAYVTMFGSALNVGLNFLMIPKFGMMGAAVSSFISYVAITWLVNQVSQKYYAIQYEVGRLLKVAGIFVVITTASCLQLDSTILDLTYRMALVVLFLAGIYILDFFYVEEKLFVESVLNLMRQKKGIHNKLSLGIDLIKS